MTDVTVVIPVGPSPHACRFLDEALRSVYVQTVFADVLLVDDMHGMSHPFEGNPTPECARLHNFALDYRQFVRDSVSLWRSPWRLGIPHAFNFGVALAPTEWVAMLGADDTMEPDAIEQALHRIRQDPPDVQSNTYYGFPVRYMDTGEEQSVPCGEAVVSKTFWRRTGGFPVESASGACDAAFLSSIWNSDEFHISMIGNRPLVNYRRHADTDTAGRSNWQSVILETRNLLTPLRKPEWGRYE